jgi:hypothetical protein
MSPFFPFLKPSSLCFSLSLPPSPRPPSIRGFPSNSPAPGDASTEPSQGKEQQQTRSLFVFSSFSNSAYLSSSLCSEAPQPEPPSWSLSAVPSTPGDASAEPSQGQEPKPKRVSNVLPPNSKHHCLPFQAPFPAIPPERAAKQPQRPPLQPARAAPR